MHILEGESLLNDASGLVCMRFALAAAITGVFSLSEAVLTFLWLAIGGLAVGVGVTWIVAMTKNWISSRFGEDTGAQILISLLIPFAAYLAAEEIHCSGILAAVGAGIAVSYAELWGRVRGETRMESAAVWNTVQFTANGAMFLILGEQIPRILVGATAAVRKTGQQDTWALLAFPLAIMAALVCLRFAWTWASLRLTLYRAALRGEPRPKSSLKLIAAVSFAGARGAITLAGVLTFPLTMPSGSPFPARDLSIFLAAAIIVLSLLAAALALPRLLAGLALPLDDVQRDEEDRVCAAAAEAAIAAIERIRERLSQNAEKGDVYGPAADHVMDTYRARLQNRRNIAERSTEDRAMLEAEQQFRLAGLRAERDEIFEQARSRKIDDRLARKLVRELDLLEARLTR